MAAAEPLLTMRGIAKRFGATQALRGVDFEVRPGEVLALIGENGAGKSTLMKVLSGAHSPDTGAMTLAGRRYAPRGPHDAHRAGVAMIYQELSLAPDLSVEDNIMLGRERSLLGWLHRAEQRRRVRAALELLGHPELNPDALVGRLSVGAQQLVEIARALAHRAQLIVFDEPTSSLTQRDVRRLFEVIGKLRSSGLGVVYISHFLEEVREVATRFVVLRDGASAGGGRLADVGDREIISLMVGRNVNELFPHTPHTPGEVLLRVDQLSGRRLPRDVSFTVRRGEIVGVAGLVGAGRTELLRCLYGLDEVRSGRVTLAQTTPALSPRARIAAGLGYVSEDRKSEGLAQNLSVADNITLSRLAPYSRCGWLRRGWRQAAVRQWMERLSVKARDGDQPVAALSGGNQQKVAFARVLHQAADVWLLDEPTRGIDVGAKADIYRLMGEQAAAGKAIIFVSSYLPELMATCDRVAVLSRGKLRDIRPTGQWTEEEVLHCAIGGEGGER